MKTIYLIRHSIKENVVSKDQKTNEEKHLSEEGKMLAEKLSKCEVLKNVGEVWASSYKRAIETAEYFGKDIKITNDFDERHYGDFDNNTDREVFWIEQFKNEKLKNINGESQSDVRHRFDKMITYILNTSESDEIAIVAHNAAILFYVLKYCKLIDAEIPKKLTISFKDKILIDHGIMKSPSIMKLDFDNNELINIDYIEI